MIYTDNMAVASGMTKLFAGYDSSYWMTHPDLACKIVQGKISCNVTVTWTKAHRRMDSALNRYVANLEQLES